MAVIHFHWRNPGVRNRLRTAVSLHGHTHLSRENLAFIPAGFRTTPLLGGLLRKFELLYRRAHGRPLDFDDLWWYPPVPPPEAFRIETTQIENVLNCRPLVSITDHDEIAASRVVQLLHGSEATPVSLEWSVPTGPSFVHLGVHNLPPTRAESIFRELQAYTAAPADQRLGELLALLNEDPATLVVLNHPLWDEAHIGSAPHLQLIRGLLERNRGRIHALELNGLRPWQENASVLALAREAGLPAVSGGDRHGTEPSACLNLTNAGSFAAFVQEIRRDKCSTILFLPRYADSHRVRQFEAVWELVRDYPEYPGRVRWTDRTFIRNSDGLVRSLSAVWKDGEPLVSRCLYQAFQLFSHEWMRPVLRRFAGENACSPIAE